MATATSKDKPTKKTENGAGYEELPDPILIDHWWSLEEGNVIEGTILETEAGQFGDFFKIKTLKPTRVKVRDSEESKMVPAGATIGVNDNAKLRQLKAIMKRGPVAVRIEVVERKKDGRGWEMRVHHRMAF